MECEYPGKLNKNPGKNRAILQLSKIMESFKVGAFTNAPRKLMIKEKCTF